MSSPTGGRFPASFSRARDTTVDAVPSRHWYECSGNDFPNRAPKFGPQTFGAVARMVVAAARPGLPERPGGNEMTNAPYADPPVGGFKPVRTLVVEVRESGITPWVEMNGERVAFGSALPADRLGKTIASLRGHMDPPPAPGAAWSPQGDLGLFVDYGEAAFTRVTIQRLAD